MLPNNEVTVTIVMTKFCHHNSDCDITIDMWIHLCDIIIHGWGAKMDTKFCAPLWDQNSWLKVRIDIMICTIWSPNYCPLWCQKEHYNVQNFEITIHIMTCSILSHSSWLWDQNGHYFAKHYGILIHYWEVRLDIMALTIVIVQFMSVMSQ